MSDKLKNLEIIQVENLSIVSLKIDQASVNEATERIELAKPLTRMKTEEDILWLAPNHWLLVSKATDSKMIVKKYTDELTGLNFNLPDQSSGVAVIRLSGLCCREILSMGSGLDCRIDKLTIGACCTTNLARIPVTVVVIESGLLELYLDSSYETYLMNWILDCNRIRELADANNHPMRLEALS